ncbi:MAG: hypothetical protein R3275_02255 [Saprospiraceae bacterium]|nr:hypothetical protein [Saprospiraceae bacterium]
MKRLDIKNFLAIIVCLFFFQMTGTAQSWETVYDNDGIEVSFKIIDCHGQNVLLFQVANQNGELRNVDFTGTIKESNGGKEMPHLYFNKEIPGNSTVEGSCPQNMTPTGDFYMLKESYSNPEVIISMN